MSFFLTWPIFINLYVVMLNSNAASCKARQGGQCFTSQLNNFVYLPKCFAFGVGLEVPEEMQMGESKVN